MFDRSKAGFQTLRIEQIMDSLQKTGLQRPSGEFKNVDMKIGCECLRGYMHSCVYTLQVYSLTLYRDARCIDIISVTG